MASLSGAMPSMRLMCSARDDDHVLIGADFRQLELWTMYAITGDEVLGAGLKTGDVYTEDAKYLFSLPPHLVRCKCLFCVDHQVELKSQADKDAHQSCKKTDACRYPALHVKPKARQDGKVSHLTFQYGAELPTFYRGLLEADQDMAYSMAGLLHAGMRKRYARTVEWWYEELARVSACGYSESRILRCRKTYPATPELQVAVNWPNQTTAAEVHGLAWLRLGSGRKGRSGSLAKFLGEALLIKQWYDAFLIEARREIVDDVIPVVRGAMEQPHVIEGKEWSFGVDIKTGKRESDV